MDNPVKSNKPNLRLRNERLQRNWSQGDLAEAIETSPVVISRWERGISLPSLHHRQKLCQVFRKSAEELGLVPEDQSKSDLALENDIKTESTEPSLSSMPEEASIIPSIPYPEEVTARLLPDRGREVVDHFVRYSIGRKILLLLGIVLLLGISGTSLHYFLGRTTNIFISAHTPTMSTIQNSSGSTPYFSRGKLVLDDSLRDNSHDYSWDERGGCQFPGDGYHVATAVKNYTFFCNAFARKFSNFIFESQMMILEGDSGGLIFRANADNSTFYYFRINQSGYYMLIIYTGHTSPAILADGTISSFHTGWHQSNLIAVLVNDGHIDLYANHEHVTGLTDDTYRQGQIGVAASTGSGGPVEVVFTNAKLWEI